LDKKMTDIWENKSDWEQKDHPHRKVIVDLVKSANPESILEFGCGYGQNLYNIKKTIPNIKAVGIDINENSIKEGLGKIKSEGVDVDMSVKDILTTDFPEKSFDVVLTDAVLLMMELKEEQIVGVIQKIVDTAKKKIVLCEWHDDRIDLPGFDVSIGNVRIARNYVELLQFCGAKNIVARKVTPEEWTSLKWQQWGYYITADL